MKTGCGISVAILGALSLPLTAANGSAADSGEALWKTYSAAGNSAYSEKKFEIAETMYQAARAEAEHFGRKDARLASSIFQLGNFYWSQKNYTKADPAYRRAVEIWETAGTPASNNHANALTGLGLIQSEQHRWPEAQEFYQSALRIWEQSNEPMSAALVVPLNNLALSLSSQGKLPEAENFYRRAQAIVEKNGGVDPHGPNVILHYLANNLFAQQRFGEAAPLYQRIRISTEAARGPDHLWTADALFEEGVNLDSAKRSAEAEPLLNRAVAIFEKSPETGFRAGRTLSALATVCEHLGRKDDAARFRGRSIASLSNANVSNSPNR